MIRRINTKFHQATLLCCILLITPSAYAGDFILGATLGTGFIDNNAYQNTNIASLFGGLKFETLVIEVGAINFGEIKLKNLSAAKLEVKGPFTQVTKTFNFDMLDFSLGAGIYDWNTKAILNGRTVGKESGLTKFIDIRMTKEISSIFNLSLGARTLNGVSGADFDNLYFGLQFKF